MLLVWTVHPDLKTIPREVTRIFDPAPAHRPAGGGGMRQPEPSRRGVLPVRPARIFIPPVSQDNYAPKLSVPIAIEAPPDIPVNPGVVGDPRGLGLGGGSGGPAGFGTGVGPSIGEGEGARFGPGTDGAIYNTGHAVSAPVPIRMPEPEYSEVARKARISGSVLIYAEIGTDGKPRNVRVMRGIGLGLDEKALEAVTRWLFKPGLKDGRPVVVRATFEVNFRLL